MNINLYFKLIKILNILFINLKLGKGVKTFKYFKLERNLK